MSKNSMKKGEPSGTFRSKTVFTDVHVDRLARGQGLLGSLLTAGVNVKYEDDAVTREEEVLVENEVFEQFLEDMGFPESQKESLRNASEAQKTELMKSHYQSSIATFSLETFIAQLADLNPSQYSIEILAARLRSAGKRFVQQFVDQGGIHLLCATLASKGSRIISTKDLDIQKQVVLCLTAVLNVEYGMQAFLSNSGAVHALVNALNYDSKVVESQTLFNPAEEYGAQFAETSLSGLKEKVEKKQISEIRFPSFSSPTTLLFTATQPGDLFDLKLSSFNNLRQSILSLLAVICYYSDDSYQIVLEAFDTYRLLKREVNRFEHLMNSITNPAYFDGHYVAACMKLINALTITPAAMSVRMHLYHEFCYFGLKEYINELQKKLHEQEKESMSVLVTQLLLFEQFSNEEEYAFEEETRERHQKTTTTNSPLFGRDPSDVADSLKETLAPSTKASASYLMTLKYLLAMSTQKDMEKVEADWATIEQLIVSSVKSEEDHVVVVPPTAVSHQFKEQLETQAKIIQELDEAKARLQAEVDETKQTIQKLDEHVATLQKQVAEKDQIVEEKLKIIAELQQRIESSGTKPEVQPPKPLESSSAPSSKVGSPVVPQPQVLAPPAPLMPGMPPPPMPPRPPGAPMMGAKAASVNLPKLPTPTRKVKTVPSATKIAPLKVEKSVWGEILAKNIAEETVNDIDYDFVEEIFEAQAKEISSEKEATAVARQSFIESSVQSKLVLLLGYLKVSKEEFSEYVMSMNLEKLQRTALETLASYKIAKDAAKTKQYTYPDHDIVAQIVEFAEKEPGNVEILTDADQLIYAMKDIPRQRERFLIWNFSDKFETTTNQLRSDLASIRYAYEALVNSKSFKVFLALSLHVLNFLNTSRPPPIAGFKLDFLSRAEDVKGKDKSSFLTAVAKVFATNPKYKGFVDKMLQELQPLVTALRINLDALDAEIKDLKSSYAEFVVPEEKFIGLKTVERDVFPAFYKRFVKDATRKFGSLEKEQRDLKEIWTARIAEAFDESPSNLANPSDFFKLILNSLEKLKKNVKDLEEQAKKQQSKSRASAKSLAKENFVDSMSKKVDNGEAAAEARRLRAKQKVNAAALNAMKSTKI